MEEKFVYGQTYYYINNTGKIKRTVWIDDEEDHAREEIGNIFRKPVYAMIHLDRLKEQAKNIQT